MEADNPIKIIALRMTHSYHYHRHSINHFYTIRTPLYLKSVDIIPQEYVRPTNSLWMGSFTENTINNVIIKLMNRYLNSYDIASIYVFYVNTKNCRYINNNISKITPDYKYGYDENNEWKLLQSKYGNNFLFN